MRQLPAAIIFSGLILQACSNETKYDIHTDDAYEKSRSSIEAIEKKSPSQFLKVTGTDKKNLLGQTVIKGNIFNNAKIVHYKDIQLKMSFYSGTGTLLEEDIETVYETVNPGGSISFKSKYFTPKGTDSVSLKVMTAKY